MRKDWTHWSEVSRVSKRDQLHHRCPGAFWQAKRWLDNNRENLSEDDLLARHRQIGEEFIDGVERCLGVLLTAEREGDDTSYLFGN